MSYPRDYVPGIPNAGHLARGGWWHPGRSTTCATCEAVEAGRLCVLCDRPLPRRTLWQRFVKAPPVHRPGDIECERIFRVRFKLL